MEKVSKFFLLFILCFDLAALSFESSNYYMNNYLFDAQVYAKDTFVTENYISHEVGNFAPYLGFLQYQGLDSYQESDIGLGSEYKLSEKLKLDIGGWYYFYYDQGGHYFEPYVSVSYDWIVSPKFYISTLSYNWEYRSFISFEKEFSFSKLLFTPKLIVGTVNYDGYRYEYVGLVDRLDYKITDSVKVFLSHEIDKPFNSMDDSVVQSLSSGINLEL